MLTPQEVNEQRFEKAVFGGYDMSAVDSFLDELGNDYGALYKENALLKNKMKVLAEAVEEYRSVDESMRKTLFSAQNMAKEMVDEAQKKADELLADAEKKSTEMLADAEQKSAEMLQKANDDVSTIEVRTKNGIKFEQEKLDELKKITAEFVARIKDSFETEILTIEELRDSEQLEIVEPKPIVEQKPEPSEERVEVVNETEPDEEPEEVQVEMPVEIPQVGDVSEDTMSAAIAKALAEAVDEESRKIREEKDTEEDSEKVFNEKIDEQKQSEDEEFFNFHLDDSVIKPRKRKNEAGEKDNSFANDYKIIGR